MDAHLNGINSRAAKTSSVRVSAADLAGDSPTLQSRGDEEATCSQSIDATKWTLVVDRPREARTLLLFDSQAEVHVEIIRLRERGVAHVFALAPVVACSDRPAVAAAALEPPQSPQSREY